MTGGFKVGATNVVGNQNPNATVHNANRWGGFYPTKYK